MLAAEGDDGAKFFEERIHPILAKHCYECHGADKQESSLRLDSRDAILKGGDSGHPSAVPHDPTKSPLIRAIRHEGDLQMPPDEKLSEAEVALLTEWVAKGLPWGSALTVKMVTPEELAEKTRREHWSLQPVRRPAVPSVQNTSWPSTGVDYFVLSKLEAAGIAPSPAADRRTLIRRLSFDLWGLPPTDEDVEAFIRDPSPDAYTRLVDRWLASPRYGERWGRHWLDVARYADTKGYAFAQDRRYPYAYTYRDYVISAFNADKPYDQFILEQLAADQLPVENDKTKLAAMGFLTTGRKFNNRQDDLDDQIDVVCRGLMGLTVSCARCHDHKYDPVPTEDYYSLYGVFASSQEPNDLPLIAEPGQGKEYEAFQKELQQLRRELEEFSGQKYAEVVKQSREKVALYFARLAEERRGTTREVGAVSVDGNDLRRRLLERWRGFLEQNAKSENPVFGPWSELVRLPTAEFSTRATPILEKWKAVASGTQAGQLNPLLKETLIAQPPPASRADVAQRYGQALLAALEKWTAAGGNAEAFGKLSPEERQLAEIIAGKDSPTDIPRDDVAGYFNRADRNKYRELEKKIQTFQASSPVAPPRAMVLKEDERPQNPRVLVRGNVARQGKSIPRQFLLVVAGSDRKPFQVRSGRLELAQLIANSDNPLTRRVIANRIWMHHFDESLVRTPSDFGTRCEQPLQAGLLEYLASELLHDDWSLKGLHREILLSNTYQQASLFRPEAAAKDSENRLYWRMNRRRLEFEPLRDSLLAAAGRLDLAVGGRPIDLFKSPYSTRRTVYGSIDRQDLPNLLRVFDFASPDQSQAERPRTAVPQQALFLMNSSFVLEQAKRLVGREEVANAGDEAAKVAALYRLLFQREPSSGELQEALEFVKGTPQDQQPTSKLSTWEQFAQLLLLTNEFTYVD